MTGWAGSGVVHQDTSPEQRTAVELAAAVRHGKSTPRELVQECLDRIAHADPRLGAFRKVRADAALQEADDVGSRPDLADLPLAGVPIAIKDNVSVTGEQCRHGSAATADRPAETSDHPVVARLRAAGAVVVGLTQTPELSLVAMTDSALGLVRNPWDLSRTPGGSSGGAASAVAAGLVPIAHGNDGLGSVRGPAACCGLLGFKPGYGTVPSELGLNSWWGLAENGVLATSVADTALMLSVLADDSDLGRIEDMARPTGLSVAVSVSPVSPGFPIDGEYKDAVNDIGAALETAGHYLVDADRYPAYLGPGSVLTWYAAAAADAEELDPKSLERRTRRLASAGRTTARLGLNGARTRRRWRDTGAERFFGEADVLLTPTLLKPPPPALRWGRRGLTRNVWANLSYAGLCAPWNLAGWPAVNIPAGLHSTGTPIGVQLVARPGQERLLLTLAATLEESRPWPRRAPPSSGMS
jgi:amidase